MAPLAASIPTIQTGTPGAILCYHAVSQRSAPEVVSVDSLRRQFEMLSLKYNVITVDQMVAEIRQGKSNEPLRIAITFDDGYKGVIQHGLPALREHGLLATAYILPGLWGTTAKWPSSSPASERRLWDREDAIEWKRSGMGIGSHGMTHKDLSEASASAVDEEVAGSKLALEEVLGPVAGFCYPWGRSSPLAQQRVEAAGYRYGLAGGYSRQHVASDLLALGRITVDHDDSLDDFRMKLRGGYDWLDGLVRLRSRLAWRP